MTNKNLKVEVSGGLPHERNLLTAVVGKSLRDVGMKEVSITNEVGAQVPASFDKLTVFDMVQGIAPAFFNAPVQVTAVNRELAFAGYLAYADNRGDEPEFFYDKDCAMNEMQDSGGTVVEIFEGDSITIEKDPIIPSSFPTWSPIHPNYQPPQSSDEEYINFLIGQINHNANSAIQGHAQTLAERAGDVKKNWARTFSSLPATVQKAYEESVQEMDRRYNGS